MHVHTKQKSCKALEEGVLVVMGLNCTATLLPPHHFPERVSWIEHVVRQPRNRGIR